MTERVPATRRLALGRRAVLAGMLAAPAAVSGARAQAESVRIAVQPGMSMMPLTIVRQRKLLEAELESRGLGATKVVWERISGGPAQNDALLSNSIDLATGGTPSMLLLWDRTRGSGNAVLGVASMASFPQRLFTRNPDVKSVADFTARDRIAVPALKVGLMPILLAMEAAKRFGPSRWNHFETMQVQLPHADATAVLSGDVQTEVTAHFSGPPQMYQQARDPKLRMVLDSNDILGGPMTQNAMWGRRSFLERNSKVAEAVLAALDRAMEMIKADADDAAATYLSAESWRLDPKELAAGIRDPGVSFTTTPVRSMHFATFMKEIGLMRTVPASWQELWIPALAGRAGS